MFPKGLIGPVGGRMVLRVYGWRPLAIYPRVEVDIRILIGFFKNGPSPASFSRFIFVFSNTHYNFYNIKNVKNVHPVFELTTFGT